MNKNMKRVMVTALTLSTLLCAAPIAISGESIFSVTAHASSENETTELKSLKLKTSGGSTIKIYDKSNYKSDNQVDSDDVEAGDTYYAKTSAKNIKISIDGPDSDYVRVFKGTSNSGKGKKISTSMSLSSGTNKIIVRVYNEKPDSNIKYKDDDDVASEYDLRIKYTGDDNDDDDKDYDDIYLSNITLSDGNIDFSKKTSKYDIYVNDSVSSLTIKAKPEDDDYDVEIDGKDVDEDDKWKTDVSLSRGENTVYIDVEDDDDNERRYTLNIYRGNNSSSSSVSSNTPSNVVNQYSDKRNQWAIVDGVWKYFDADGNYLRNTWYYDVNYCSTYYFREDGSMATGWIKDGTNWFYADNSGARRIGWQYVDGKWYYMQSTGIMAQNTRLGIYVFGADGAWIY